MTRRNYARVKQCPGGGPASHDIRLRVFARQRRFISRIRRPQLAAAGFVPSPRCVTGSLCTPHLAAYNVRKLPYDRLKRLHPFPTFAAFQPVLIYVRSQHLFFQFYSLSVLRAPSSIIRARGLAILPRPFLVLSRRLFVGGYVSCGANATHFVRGSSREDLLLPAAVLIILLWRTDCRGDAAGGCVI